MYYYYLIQFQTGGGMGDEKKRRELIRAAKTVCKEEDLYSCLKCNARIRNKIVLKKKKKKL